MSRRPYASGSTPLMILCYYSKSMPNIKFSKLADAKRSATKRGDTDVLANCDKFGAPFVAAFKRKGRWMDNPTLVNADIPA